MVCAAAVGQRRTPTHGVSYSVVICLSLIFSPSRLQRHSLRLVRRVVADFGLCRTDFADAKSEFGLGIDFGMRCRRGAMTAFLQIVLGEGSVDGADKERNEGVVTVFDRCHELSCFSQVASDFHFRSPLS